MAFIWHSLCESKLLSASKNVCHAEIRRSGPELHISYNVIQTIVVISKFGKFLINDAAGSLSQPLKSILFNNVLDKTI